jgi:transposase
VVPYRTLHRFASERCGFGREDTTVRVVDGDPGVECQIDFGYLGMLTDADDGRRRKVYALIFTAVYSRHMFVWLSYSQTLAAVLAGCQAAWEFFGGVFAVLIPDNLKPVIAAADAVNPQFTQVCSTTPGMAGSSPTRPGWRRRRTSPAWNAACSTCAETSGTVKH